MESLNDHCLWEIFQYSSLMDLHALSHVSQRFRQLIRTFSTKKKISIKIHRKSVTSVEHGFFKSMFTNVGHHIHSLSINFDPKCKYFRPEDIMDMIQEHCTGTLKHLHIFQWHALEPTAYGPLLEGLQSLALVYCRRPRIPCDSSTINVLFRLNQLETFSMIKCVDILSAHDLNLLLKNNPKMRRLRLQVDDDHSCSGLFDILGTLPDLKYLSLHFYLQRPIDCLPLANLKALRGLEISLNTPYFIDLQINQQLLRAFMAFQHHGKLEELSLFMCHLDNDCYKAIGRIASLRDIILDNHKWDTDNACQLISAYGQLHSIHLSCCPLITNAGLVSIIAACPKMHIVKTSFCRRLTPVVLPEIYETIKKRGKPLTPFKLFMIPHKPGFIQDSLHHIFNPAEMQVIFQPSTLFTGYPLRSLPNVPDANHIDDYLPSPNRVTCAVIVETENDYKTSDSTQHAKVISKHTQMNTTLIYEPCLKQRKRKFN